MSPNPGASLVAQLVKNSPAMQETMVWSPGLGRSPGEEKRYPLTPLFWPGEFNIKYWNQNQILSLFIKWRSLIHSLVLWLLGTISYNKVVSPILCGTVEVQDWVSEWVKVAQSCLTLCNPWIIQSMEFSRPEYGVGSLSLLQGIFPTQGIKPQFPSLWAD